MGLKRRKKEKRKFRISVKPNLKKSRSVVNGTLSIIQNFKDTRGYKKDHKNFVRMDEDI